MQIARALQHEERVREGVDLNDQKTDFEKKGQQIAIDFLERLPDLRKILATDVQASYDGDPACQESRRSHFLLPGT